MFWVINVNAESPLLITIEAEYNAKSGPCISARFSLSSTPRWIVACVAGN